MRLTQLQPIHDNNQLVGWTVRFTDEAGLVRIANLGLGCLMDPSAFTEAVCRQGVAYANPYQTDPTAWKAQLRNLTVWPSRKVV